MAQCPGELQLIDRTKLVVGRPLEGHVRDAKGRVLILAGTTLTPAHLRQLGKRLITGLYGGADWGPADDLPTISPDELVDDLLAHQDPGQTMTERRARERHKWNVPLKLLLAERTSMGPIYREIQATTADLSRTGFAFIHRYYVAVNTRVEAQFDQLPNKPRVEGVVRNCRLITGLGHRVGVQFVQPNELTEATP